MYFIVFFLYFFFFFSSRRRHTRSLCDWSSDVCSSDLRASGSARSRRAPTQTRPPSSSKTETSDCSYSNFRAERLSPTVGGGGRCCHKIHPTGVGLSIPPAAFSSHCLAWTVINRGSNLAQAA